MVGSFSPVLLVGPDTFVDDMEEIAESIEEVRGMADCTDGSALNVRLVGTVGEDRC